jgi:hypothetical protein
MSRYAITAPIPADIYADAAHGIEQAYADKIIHEVEGKGYTVTGQPVCDWSQLDEHAAAVVARRWPGTKAGDWMIRAIVTVAEPAPIGRS